MLWGSYLSPRIKISLAAVEDEDSADNVLFVQRGVMRTEFVREGETVNSESCSPVQKWLCERSWELRRQFGEKGIWFVISQQCPCSFRHDTEAWHGASHNASNHQPSRQLRFRGNKFIDEDNIKKSVAT